MAVLGQGGSRSMKTSTALLELRHLAVAYGGIQAVKGIDAHVDAGELVCLIGANGAGKTTTLKGICGMLPIKSGSIHYDGRDVTGKPPFELVRGGLAMVPEGRGVFGGLTIEENLAMGALEVSHRGYVMESGEIILEGKARDLLHDRKVRAAYLGETI